MLDINIITQPARMPLETTGLMVCNLINAWRARGLSVGVQVGPKNMTPAKVGFLHVNLTWIPQDYAACSGHFSRTINACALDISKRRVSSLMVRPGDGYHGPVIVKTDMNNRGLPEQKFNRSRLSSQLLWKASKIFRRNHHQRLLEGRRYPVFTDPGSVPDYFWSDARFIVEQYIPEMHGDETAVRYWLFLGDRSVQRILFANKEVAKSASRTHSEYLTGPVPDVLRRERQRLGLDFGRIDYVLKGGKPIILDANKTPGSGTIPEAVLPEFIEELAPGIDTFLADSNN